jgi:hypothetical protein
VTEEDLQDHLEHHFHQGDHPHQGVVIEDQAVDLPLEMTVVANASKWKKMQESLAM